MAVEEGLELLGRVLGFASVGLAGLFVELGKLFFQKGFGEDGLHPAGLGVISGGGWFWRLHIDVDHLVFPTVHGRLHAGSSRLSAAVRPPIGAGE